jgi:hypothetical protein
MSYVTLSEARAAGQTHWVTKSLAESALRRSAASPATTKFDVFLSHAREDAQVIAGVKAMLEAEGLSVYVYWAEENQTRAVTAATAANLRARMNHSRSLIFASSQSSPDSKWMPWELGYFDGRNPGRVATMPLPSSALSTFDGQEYLGLYPKVERISWDSGRRSLGISTGPTTAKSVQSFITDGVTL